MALPYYPRYPRDFLDGTASMSFELKGAYSILLDVIYAQDGRCPDNDRYVAGLLGCSVRAWRVYKNLLVEIGKINVDNGIISNFRADKELVKSRLYQEQQRQNGLKPKKISEVEKPSLNQTKTESKPYILDTNVSNTNAREPLGDFETFWKAWPHKVGKPAAVKSYQSAIKRGHSHEQVMEGLRRYIRGKPPDRSWLNPATFLNQERYNDEPASSHNNQTNHTTINPDGSPSAETFGRTIPFPNKQGLGGRAGAALRSLQERAGMDRDW
jgi:uncharacterized protein YdaU (DUF1376 family)